MHAVVRRHVAAPVAVALCLAGHAARADGGSSAAAEALFRQGRASAEAGDPAGACVAFAESLRIEWAPGTLLNLADCEERTGRLARAWADFARLERAAAPGDARKALAHARAAALAPRLARMTVAFAADAAAPAPTRPSPWAPTRAPLFIAAGTGVVSLGVAASLRAGADRSPGDETTFGVALGVGVLGLTVAATLWLTAPKDAPRAAGLVVTPSGVGAVW